MRKRNPFITLLALMLVVVLVLPSVVSLAEGSFDYSIRVRDGEITYSDTDDGNNPWPDYPGDETLNMDLKPIDPVSQVYLIPALGVDSQSESTPSSFTVEGDIIKENQGDLGVAALCIDVAASNDGLAVVTADNVIAVATSENGVAQSRGISANAETGGDILIHINGDISATGIIPEDSSWYGDVTGIKAIAESEGTVTVQVDGAVKTATESGSDSFAETAVTATARGENSQMKIDIGEGSSGSVYVGATDKGLLEMNVLEGGIELDKFGHTIQTHTTGEGKANVSVTGGVTATDGIAISARCYTDGITIFKVVDGKDGSGVVTKEGDAIYIVNGNESVDVGGTVNIDIKGDAISENGRGAVIYSNDGTTQLTVSGDLTSKYDSAVYADIMNGAVLSIDIDGKTSANQNEYYTIDATANGEGSVFSATLGNGVDGEVSLFANDGAEMHVTVEDGGIAADHEAVWIRNNDSTIDLNVQGEIRSDDAYGLITAESYGENAVTTLTLDGDITAENEFSNNKAVILSVYDEGVLKANITADSVSSAVTGDNDWETETTALTLNNVGGTLEVDIIADISATGADVSTGVCIGTYNTGYTAYIDGDAVAVEGTPDGFEPAMHVYEDEDGNIISGQDTVIIDGVEYPAYMSTDPDSDDLYIIGEDGKYYKVSWEAVYEKGSTNLTVTGNVTGDQYGMILNVAEVQDANVVVDGTVVGGSSAVVLQENTEIGDNLTLTVWEIVPDENDALIVRESQDDGGNVSYEQDKDAEKYIQYIIKIEPASENYINTYGTSSHKAGNGESYQVANENDTVYVKLTIPEGKELVSAYWDKEKTDAGRLLLDSSTGDYYLQVPRGGGVLLSVVLKDVPVTQPESDQKSDSAVQDSKPNNAAPIYTLQFFEDAQAEASIVKVSAGKVYTLPTPVREGRTFVGWAESDITPSDPDWKEPSEGDASILPGGMEYTVTGNKCFVGIWK